MAGKRNLKAKQVTPDELTQLAAVTQADIARAQMAWEEIAPSGFKPLLDAVNDPKRTDT